MRLPPFAVKNRSKDNIQWVGPWHHEAQVTPGVKSPSHTANGFSILQADRYTSPAPPQVIACALITSWYNESLECDQSSLVLSLGLGTSPCHGLDYVPH